MFCQKSSGLRAVFVFLAKPRNCDALKSPRNGIGTAMIEGSFGANVDYAMLVKIYGADPTATSVTARQSALARSNIGSKAIPIPSMCRRRASKSYAANEQSSFYSAHQRILKEGRKSCAFSRPALHAL
jgi:hypothetical protein